MVCVIKDTADISTVFAKIDMTQHKNKLPPVSFKQFEKFLHPSFGTVENFSNSKPRPPGQRKLGKNPTRRAAITCESPAATWGMVRLGIDLYITFSLFHLSLIHFLVKSYDPSENQRNSHQVF